LPARAGSLRDTDREPTHRTRRPEVHQWPRPPSFAFLRDVGCPTTLPRGPGAPSSPSLLRPAGFSKLSPDEAPGGRRPPHGSGQQAHPLRYRTAFASSTFPPHTTMGWSYGSLAVVNDQGGGMGFLAFDVSSLLEHGGPTPTPVARHLRGVT
jgi:hypothetical protein